MDLIKLIPGAIIAILITTTVLFPIVDTDNMRTYATNTVGYSATIADTQDEVDTTMSWDTTDKKLIVDGINYSYSINDAAAFSDTWVFTTTTVSPWSTFVYIENGASTSLTYKSISVEISSDSVDITYVDNSDVTHTKTIAHEWVCYRNNAGTDRLANVITTAKTVYYDDENPIYASGTSGVKFKGDVANRFGTEAPVDYDGTTYLNDVYKVTINFTTGSEMSTEIGGTTYYPMYIAVSGSIDCSSQEEDQIYALIAVIPILVTIGILMMIVTAFIRRD